MTWEEKLAALQSLGDCCLRMRHPGDWYVSATSVEVSSGRMLEGRYGNGATPEAAVLDHWEKYTALVGPGEVVVINAMSTERRHVRWTGYMWTDVPFERQQNHD